MNWWIVGAVAAVVLLLVVLYNRLVALRQGYRNAFADIDVQLKQRHDLIPSLVETVKGYAAHERGVLETVTAARASAMRGGSVENRAAAESALSGALANILAVAENYPDLKANANFQQLQMELGDIENKLAASRRFFNNSVAEYNTAIEQVPAVFVARLGGFQPATMFEIEAGQRAAMDEPPKVSFS